MATIKGAEPYELGKGERAVLLIHGLTGTPFEMRPFAEHLSQNRYIARGILLPGHGTTPQDLNKKTWNDWYSFAEKELKDLHQKTHGPVFLAGLSLGAMLCLELAASRPELVSAVSVMSVPLKPAKKIIWIARLFKYSPLRPLLRLPKKSRDDEARDDLRLMNPSYDVMPARALVQLIENIPRIMSLLPEIRTPAIVAHSRLDPTAKLDGARLAYKLTGSSTKEFLVLERSLHLITLDIEREMLFHRIDSFFGRAS